MKFLFYSLTILLTFMACSDKKEERTIDSSETTEEVQKPGIKVTLEAIVPQSDTLQIYYRLNPNSEYISKQSVNAIVSGKDSVQNIVFDLPGNEKISDFRLDIGNNKNQGPIQFKKFRMDYNGKSFETRDTMFIQYFNPNDQIEYDRKTSTAKTIKSTKPYDPLFIPREPLNQEIEKLYQ